MEPHSYFYQMNGITLHVKEAGNKALPAILFLNGFPSFWYSWQKQIEFFSSQGNHVIVPDKPRYNASDKPNESKDYRFSVLVEDMVQLPSPLKVKEATPVAHDWGSIVAWALPKTQN